MAGQFQAIRGMNDILPEQAAYWQYVEALCVQVVEQYCYQEIRFPLLESTGLFKRTVGEVTDIVEKEMYTFEDRNGDSLSLRPEGTAGCVRAAIEHGLLHNQIQRLWYQGPMYRHERPQKGRYRQFHQFSVEAFGVSSPLMEAEQVALMWRIFSALGLEKTVSLQINSLGLPECRAQYRQALVEYFSQHASQLDEDSKRRLHTNPMRILDSKNPKMQALLADAPDFKMYWSDSAVAHFNQLCDSLTSLTIPFEINTRIVRGLDYYCHTVYEWVTTELGAQGTVCAGGRYDGLVAQLGGKPTPAVGFSLGLERLVLLLLKQTEKTFHADAYLIAAGESAQAYSLVLAEQLRNQLPHLKLAHNTHGGSIKSQFKRADKSGARFALILAEDEMANQQVTVKDLTGKQEQQTLSPEAVIALLAEKL